MGLRSLVALATSRRYVVSGSENFGGSSCGASVGHWSLVVVTHPPIHELYLAELKKRLLEHTIPARIFALEQSVLANPDQPLTPAQIREANTIDNLRKQAMLGAEKKCRKLRMGNIPYSLETATIGNEIR